MPCERVLSLTLTKPLRNKKRNETDVTVARNEILERFKRFSKAYRSVFVDVMENGRNLLTNHVESA